ncbi:MAG: anthranilate synthase component I [Candidatus Nanopelagicales bacterium]|jgi:anthranilate synthase component 1|nr:anthranilate synthase component I [Candidatus Nanopelagicales bacterium]
MSDFSGETTPRLEEFRTLARDRRVIPVTRRFLADGATAVGLFETLCGDRAGTFLLESAEQGRTWSRYSFIGVRCSAMLTVRDGQAVWLGRAPHGVPADGPAVDVVRETVKLLHTTPLPDMPPLTGGLIGYLTYDAVRAWESVPDENPDLLGVPDLAFLLATDLAVVDHADGSVMLIANAINYDATDDNVDEAYAAAVVRLDSMTQALARPRGLGVATYVPGSSIEPFTSQQDYVGAVDKAQEYIRSGDVFQVVLSQRFSSPCPAESLDVYRVLRATNPSPYMYLVRMPIDDGVPPDEFNGSLSDQVAFDIVGSSPEALVTVTDGHCVVHPIAGTRPRGITPEQDSALADELLADVKERAEHVMLVDLARNDLGRVCAPGSVTVVDFMNVERYSHVMHLVSTVTGTLADGRSAYDALAATFPAGTLSGAPKPRAMAIIDELEPLRRGLYGGCVGYIDFAGNLDTAIAIRTAVIKDGVAHVQAGAGIVADSVAESEALECVNKAAAVLRAVVAAGSLRNHG